MIDAGGPTDEGGLAGVSCVGPAYCVAVGVHEQSQTPVVERWTGSALSIMPSPDPTPPRAGGASLSGVSCPSTTTCIAVGVKNVANYAMSTLVEQFDGATWSVVGSPTPAPTTDVLSAVTCLTATNCLAVGHYDTLPTNPLDDASLIERWNGTRWSRMAAPRQTYYPRLDGVTCATASRCFAVGNQLDTDFNQSLLIDQWNGGQWSSVNAKSPSTTGLSVLYGAICASATRCYAFGSYRRADNRQVPLVETWDGRSWAIMPSPSASFGRLVGGSCPTASTCFAVGYSFPDNISQAPLIYHYGVLGLPERAVFDLLLGFAITEDGALHAEKYYRTVSEEFAASRPAFRWRHLVALARVTASEFGFPAGGVGDACKLLKV